MNRKDILAILSGAVVSVVLSSTAVVVLQSAAPISQGDLTVACLVAGLSAGYFVGGPVSVAVRRRLE